MGTPEISNNLRFADYLKFWREVFQLSQEQLAERVGSSVRHISRLENGTSKPSEALTRQIAKALNLGRRDSSHLRIAAGFAPNETPQNFHGPELRWLRSAMLRTLQALDPHPTTLTDSSGQILMVNRAWVGFYQDKVEPERLKQTVNLYDFLFNDGGSSTLTEEWKDALSLVIMAFKQNVMLNSSPLEEQTLQRILDYPSVPTDWMQRAARLEPRASFKIRIKHKGLLHTFYSVSQTVGAIGPAAYLTEPKLSINTLYPENTALDLAELVNNAQPHPLLFY